MKRALYVRFCTTVIFTLFLVDGWCQNLSSFPSGPSETTKGKLLFEDTGSKNYVKKWFVDGQQGVISNGSEGMLIEAGPAYGNDSSHLVIWTKKSFRGDILIEFDYTRTDTTTRCVNILYFHTTGQGGVQYPKDIRKWRDKRQEPKMRHYFNHMNTYHLSFAAFDAIRYSGDNDYIRMRQYDPSVQNLVGTDIEPDIFNTGMFKPYVTYHVEVSMLYPTITMNVVNKDNPSETLNCEWDLGNRLPLKMGRIGIRHMYTRKAIYKDFRVWSLINDK